jgi:hypothetical protein
VRIRALFSLREKKFMVVSLVVAAGAGCAASFSLIGCRWRGFGGRRRLFDRAAFG